MYPSNTPKSITYHIRLKIMRKKINCLFAFVCIHSNVHRVQRETHEMCRHSSEKTASDICIEFAYETDLEFVWSSCTEIFDLFSPIFVDNKVDVPAKCHPVFCCLWFHKKMTIFYPNYRYNFRRHQDFFLKFNLILSFYYWIHLKFVVFVLFFLVC